MKINNLNTLFTVFNVTLLSSILIGVFYFNMSWLVAMVIFVLGIALEIAFMYFLAKTLVNLFGYIITEAVRQAFSGKVTK